VLSTRTMRSFAWTLPLLLVGCASPVWMPAPLPPHAMVVAPPYEHRPLPPPPPPPVVSLPTAAELASRTARFAPVALSADVSRLPESERRALAAILDASRLLEPIFDRQAFAGNPALAAALAEDTSELGAARRAYYAIMRGPWDRLDHSPFAIERPRPPGAGFYPEDLGADELERYLVAHPEARERVLGLFTVVAREGDQLTAVPYSKAYAEWLVPAAAKLREAARLTKNRSLARFLTSRAAAFLDDDYYASDKDWMDLDAVVEVTIGPYEQYEDELRGQKTAFQSFVTIADPTASKALARWKSLLPAMQENLPVDAAAKPPRGLESPIRVVDLVFASGDARHGVMTSAFNLPNDERVRKEKGAKKVLLRNVLDMKFAKIMRPIGERILAPEHLAQLSSAAFVDEVLFHELSHSLGPAQAASGLDVGAALEELHAPLEEAKADVMGAYNVLYMVQRGELPKARREEILVTYFAGLFRSVRFGVDAHGRGAALQINRYVAEGAVKVAPDTGRIALDLAALERAIVGLTRDLCELQRRGDKAEARALLERYGVVSDILSSVQAMTRDLPVDLVASYPLAGEAP